MEFLPILAEFYVTDFARSLKFYVDTIGFKVEYQRKNPKFAFLSYNGSQIMIQELIPGEKEVEKLEYPFGRGINFQIDCKSVQKIIYDLNIYSHQTNSYDRNPPSFQIVDALSGHICLKRKV